LHEKLKWDAIGFVSKTKILLENVVEIKDELPNNHSKRIEKVQRLIDELRQIIKVSTSIKQELIPNLERLFRLTFKTPELILLALSRPSLRHIYENVETILKKNQRFPLKSEEYKDLESSGDAANVLALIGDSVLNLAIIQLFWDSTLSTAGALTRKKESIVSNENLTKLCDKLNLHSYRLKRLNDPSEKKTKNKTIIHEKGTLVESLYGVIYLEFGLENLIRLLPFIQ